MTAGRAYAARAPTCSGVSFMSTSQRAPHASKINAPVRRSNALAGYRWFLIAQCLGLTVACAQAQDVDRSPVAPISLADATLPPPDAAVGSGGMVGSGSGGKMMTGSGGASGGSGGAPASGGTPGKGGSSGSAGASSGGAPASGGKVGAGGMPATGGATSGGAPSNGGAATGGKASGGTSSGGTSSGGAGTGGTSSGGAGTGGGGPTCKGYVTDDACSRCICQKCASQVAACFDSSDSTKNQKCKAIQDCAEEKHCASSPCYCNQATNIFCEPPDGPCADVIEASIGGNPSAITVQQRGGDSSDPIGRANAIGMCSTSNCKSECQIP
jgi:hypothetical protein